MSGISRRHFLRTSGIGIGLLGSTLKTWGAPTEPVDAVIIGSGFGGSIAALRLAQAGIKSVVLERGRRWPISAPNASLPDFGQNTFATFEKPDGRASWLSKLSTSIDNPPIPIDQYIGVLELIQAPALDQVYGSKIGGIHANGIAVRNGAGVGGGSLVYNAILLQPRRELFQQVFPSSVDYDEMDQVYYPRVRTIINGSATPNTIPADILATDYYASTRVNLQQAQNAGFLSNPPKLVEYGVNWDVVRQEINGKARPSAIDGQSWYGLNSGAKNSVDKNYLAMAEATGRVEVLPQHMVLDVTATTGNMYIVSASQIDTNGNVVANRLFVTKRVFFGAGSMGTSALLVKARVKGTLPHLSSAAGQFWGSNGDFILFRGGLGNNNAGTGGPSGHFVFENLNNPYSPSDAVELVVPKPQAFPGASLYVGLGLAPAVGQFAYDATSDSAVLNWPRGAASLARAVAGAQTFDTTLDSRNPGSFTAFSSLTTPPDLTAHPVGGAAMGVVCSPFGQVKGYHGLYVVDGAFIPGGSVGGVNPSFTIAALAERSMDKIVQTINDGTEFSD